MAEAADTGAGGCGHRALAPGSEAPGAAERAARSGARVATAAVQIGLARARAVVSPVMRLPRERADDEWPDPDALDWGVEAASRTEPAPEPASEPAGAPAGAVESGLVPEPAVAQAPDSHAESAPDAEPLGGPGEVFRSAEDSIFPALDQLLSAYRLVAVIVTLLVALVVSVLVPSHYPLRSTVAALHVLGLVVSFGAVLLLDWHGILWLAGLRRLGESVRLSAAGEPLIWAALLWLVLTGALLRPDLSSPLVLTKLVLAAAVVWHTAGLSRVRLRLAALPDDIRPGQLSQRDSRLLMTSLIVSQLGWWGATVIGFMSYAS